ncbi:MAG: D-alanine--D-alanine ligase [Planctomycetota bacterium]|nr:D-alanine--D-alanine ligase [Planctomycetota bacterium]
MKSPAISTPRGATVAVLLGGRSSEREVSLKSGAAVAAALRDAQDGLGPARVLEIEITPTGAWRFEGEDHAAEEALTRIPRSSVFFLALHGGEGEDGTIQGLLAATGRAHTGSGVAASALCLCKSWTRSVLGEAGLAVAPGRTIDAAQWALDPSGVLDSVRALSPSGWAVKPDRGGSSVATFVLEDAALLRGAIEAVLATQDRALVEARVRGIECTVAILGNREGAARALMPVEIVPKDGRFFDYEEKYSAAGASEHCPPLAIDAATCRTLQSLGERAHVAAGCDGYSRIDFIVPEGGGLPVVLEINTLPGMTSRSLLPLAAAQAGLSFRALCLRLVELALERNASTRAGPAR